MIIRTLKNDETEHRVGNDVIEIASDSELRAGLGLVDGATVVVSIG